MAYLRRLKTKLQFSHRDSNNDGLFNDVNDVNGNSKVLTHSQWAHIILGSIIMGTILGYGQYYPVLNQIRYIFAIGLAIIVVCIFKALQSSNRWHSLSKLMDRSITNMLLKFMAYIPIKILQKMTLLKHRGVYKYTQRYLLLTIPYD